MSGRKSSGCKTCGGPCAPYTQCWSCWGKEIGTDEQTLREWRAEDARAIGGSDD